METLKVYVDANIFIDYLRQRTDGLRPLGEFAFQFFSDGWNCKFKLIISDWLLTELEKHLSKDEIEFVLKDFKDKEKIILVKSTREDKTKSKNYAHPEDALHAILANKAGANYLVTRNQKDYVGCENLVKIVFPEYI
ncbi:MAG: PIN domain-containing protein [Nanoarchaeota archaeon]|nr:PIN domain-containing protein [Nanoarchaeota archaeon]